MPFSRNLFSGKRRYLVPLMALLFIATISMTFSSEESYDFNFAKREVLLRRIGHEILLKSGDSTSRVLPIKKITENEYQISFEKEFTFQPDFLIKIMQRLLIKDEFATDFVVNVLNCKNSNIVYGCAISKDKKEDIISCIGRKQPKGCYIINIKFKTKGIYTAKNGYLLGGLLILVIAGFIFMKSVKSNKNLPKEEEEDSKIFTFGSVLFKAQNRQLVINNNTIDLTATETRVLLIFASSPNEIIARSRLQKEIWEDEGVIVGRSLDMFISKLRKKLELDSTINLVVIRGKGYKLEVNS
jgi:DNA-binding winged helix-turn-helix (wHTH) protein